ncbi:MAG: hypothetical protein JNL11_11580 [Bdellovibrionaceae bacterium]|nr:hypothetical protein [Pseudobdellovibrionaceae bacterium]
MKVSIFDFILSGLAMAILWLVSALVTFGFLAEYFILFLGSYGYLVNLIFLFTFYGLFSGIAIKTLLFFRPLECGDFDMNHPNFTYWKLLTMLHMFGDKFLFSIKFPPMIPLIARLYGAKIGRYVAIGGTIDSPFLLQLGDHSVLGFESLVSGNVIQNGKIKIGKVNIGSGVTVGAYSFTMPDVEIGDGAIVVSGSVVVPGSQIRTGEVWKGNPARKWQ